MAGQSWQQMRPPGLAGSGGLGPSCSPARCPPLPRKVPVCAEAWPSSPGRRSCVSAGLSRSHSCVLVAPCVACRLSLTVNAHLPSLYCLPARPPPVLFWNLLHHDGTILSAGSSVAATSWVCLGCWLLTCL